MKEQYKIQTASDIIRDGLGVELVNSENDVLAEIFRNDSNHTLIVNTFQNELPLDAIESLVKFARERLEPFEDGTPLLKAKNICHLGKW